MGLEDINAGEEEADRAMDKYVPWVFWTMAVLTVWYCVNNEINCHFERREKNEEMQDFREKYLLKKSHRGGFDGYA